MIHSFAVIDHCVDILQPIYVSCNVDYSSRVEEKRHFATGWQETYINWTLDADPSFTYRSELGEGVSYWGEYASYYGAGYVATLGNTVEEANEMVAHLKNNSWFDRYTRGLVMEVNLYNGFVNQFSMVSILLEFPSHGGPLPHTEIRTVSLYRYFGNWGVLALAAEVVCILFVIALIIRMGVKLGSMKCGYFKNFWHRLELFKILLVLSAFVFYFLRIFFVKYTVEKLMNNRGKTTSS